MSEDPLGHVPALLPGFFIREAEMDALVDADIDRIPGQIREAVIRVRVRVSQRVLAEDRESDMVRPEEELQRSGQRANRVIGARGVVRIVWSIEQRFPGRVAGRPRVAVIIAFLDGCDRSPKDVVNLIVPSDDERIGHRQSAERQQSCIVTNIIRMRCGDIPESSVPEDEVIPSIEIGKSGLFRSAGAVEAGAQSLNLIIVLGVPFAAQGRRCLGAELVSAFQGEGRDRAQPRSRHRREGRRRPSGG